MLAEGIEITDESDAKPLAETLTLASRSRGRGSQGAWPRYRVVTVAPRLLSRVTTREQDVFSIAVVAYVLFSLLDCLTTAVALASGMAYERNPVASSIYAAHGIIGLYLAKFVVVAVIIVGLRALPRHVALWVATCFTAFSALAVVANLHVILYG